MQNFHRLLSHFKLAERSAEAAPKRSKGSSTYIHSFIHTV